MRGNHVSTTLTTTLLLLGAAGALEAQAAPAGDARAAAFAKALEAGRTVRVGTDGRRVTGTVVRADGATIVLRDERGETTVAVAVAAVDTLWQRGKATKTGAIVGAGAGLVAGTILGIEVKSEMEEGSTNDDWTLAIPVGAVGGTLVGGLIGAGVGSAFGKWTRVWPAN